MKKLKCNNAFKEGRLTEMANRRTGEERLLEIDEKLKQLQAQKQSLMKREQEKSRKERTRRLIQLGALAEKYFDCVNIEPSKFENLLKNIINADQVKLIMSQTNSNIE